MKVLLVHNQYRAGAPSGEDAAVCNEHQMLEKRGVQVFAFNRCNDDIDESSFSAKMTMAANTIWSQRSRSDLSKFLRQVRPDVVHVHNTFAMLSPSVYGACKAQGVPVVQTLHNFRFFCPAAMFLRDGKPCEECVDRTLLQSVKHRCYRGSFTATATVASMLTLHRAIGTYSQLIDRYIALTHFARSKIIKGGIADHKVVLKPNFVPDPPAAGNGGGGYVAYVGGLLKSKGTETLVAAWRALPMVKLKIVGDGELRTQCEAIVRQENLNIEFTGMQNRSAVLKIIANAEILIVPSEWYEGFPMVVAESFACGTPILASRIGSLEELVQDDVMGKQFTAGDPKELAEGVRRMLADPDGLRRMRANARAYFDDHLTEQHNYTQLLSIYSDVIDKARFQT